MLVEQTRWLTKPKPSVVDRLLATRLNATRSQKQDQRKVIYPLVGALIACILAGLIVGCVLATGTASIIFGIAITVYCVGACFCAGIVSAQEIEVINEVSCWLAYHHWKSGVDYVSPSQSLALQTVARQDRDYQLAREQRARDRDTAYYTYDYGAPKGLSWVGYRTEYRNLINAYLTSFEVTEAEEIIAKYMDLHQQRSGQVTDEDRALKAAAEAVLDNAAKKLLEDIRDCQAAEKTKSDYILDQAVDNWRARAKALQSAVERVPEPPLA